MQKYAFFPNLQYLCKEKKSLRKEETDYQKKDMKKILGVGNALVDILVKLQDETLLSQLSLPKGSMQLISRDTNKVVQEKIKSIDKEMVAGGSAANAIRGIAHLGIETGFIGMLGKDDIGKTFEQELLSANVNPHLSYSSSNESGTATTFVSPDSERTFATYLGAAIELHPDLLSKDVFKGYDYFHIEGYLVQNHDLISNAIKLAKSCGLKVSLDLASYNVVEENLDFLQNIIREYVDIVFANEEEAFAFTGLNADAALEKIAEMCEIAIVKIGKKGSMIQQGNIKITIDTINSKPLDTTGAGDLYAAGFLFGLANNFSLEKSGNIGKILAGNVIEVLGVTMDENRWESIKKGIKEL